MQSVRFFMQRIPPNIRQTVYRLRGLFLTMALVLILGITLTLIAGERVLEARNRVQRHDKILELLHATRAVLRDAEAGQRGYLLTGHEEFFETYREASELAVRRLASLGELAAEGALSQDVFEELETLAKRALTAIRRPVDLARAGRGDEARRLTQAATENEPMRAVHERFVILQHDEESERALAHRDDARATWNRTFISLLTASINLAFLGWAYHRIRREMSSQYVAALETERQRQILSVTLASIGDAVIITDTAGQVTFINKVAETLTGWSSDQACGRPSLEVFRIIDEKTRRPVESPVQKVLARGEIVGLAVGALLVRRDGREVAVDDSGAPIREPDGTIRGVVLVFRDFTAHREAERNLLESKRQIEEASVAKDRFLATLSHELRTPLTPVLATLSHWEAARDLPPELLPQLSMMRENIQVETRLIDDLLDMTRIVHGKLLLERSPVDLHRIVKSTVRFFDGESRNKGISLRIETAAETSFVFADQARLQQVLWNLVGNAMKFTTRGGEIFVSTSTGKRDRLEIRVSDTGHGMSPQTLAGLFQPFHQGDLAPEKRNRGLGLGLSISRALVEAHGGTLKAESDGPGRGSTFTVALPTIPPPLEHRDRESPITEAVSQNLRILLVEDHRDTADVLCMILRNLGHRVESCGTLAGAREMAAAGDYDLILSDLGLPDGTGIEFIRAVRPLTTTPAVALTGYGTPDDVEACLRAGFTDHLTKPIDIGALQRVLRHARRAGDG